MNKKLSLIFIVVGVVLLGTGVVLMVTSSSEQEMETPKKEDIVSGRESLDINGDLTQGLYYMTKSSWSRENNVKGLYHYKKDSILVSDFEKEHLFEIVFDRLNRKKLITNESVSEDIVIKEFEEIFGNSVQYNSLGNFAMGCNLVNYDVNNKVYNIIYTNCIVASTVEGKVIAAYKEQNKIFIEEKVLFYNSGSSYYDPEFMNPTDSKIDDEDEKMLVYRYTFIFDEKTNNYHYYSIEKVSK